jgi:hypothetical protein
MEMERRMREAAVTGNKSCSSTTVETRDGRGGVGDVPGHRESDGDDEKAEGGPRWPESSPERDHRGGESATVSLIERALAQFLKGGDREVDKVDQIRGWLQLAEGRPGEAAPWWGAHGLGGWERKRAREKRAAARGRGGR